MKSLILVLFLALVTACAHVHQGELAEGVSGEKIQGLSVSAEELSDPSEESFSMIALTFENKAPEWLRVEKVDVLIGEENADKISVVVGSDLQSWASAMEARNRLKQQNAEASQLGLTLGGITVAAIGAATRNNTLTTAGVVGAGAGQGWMVSNALTTWYDNAKNPKAVPSDYVTQPFSVPGKMFLRRWLLLNKPVGRKVSILPIAVLTVDGRREVLNVKLR